MQRLGLLGALLCLACLPEVAPSNPYDPDLPIEQQQPARLQGVVVSSLTKTPVVGASLLATGLVEPLDNPVASDAAGNFDFRALAPGRYYIEVSHAEHLHHSFEVELRAGEQRRLTLHLVPGVLFEEQAHIYGTAYKEAQLNVAVELADHSGIVVEIDAVGVRTVTNVQGRFDLWLAAGTYDLAFRAPDHVAAERLGVRAGGGEAVQVPDSPVVLLANPATLRGHVVARTCAASPLEEQSLPAEDAVVSLVGTSHTAITDAAGAFVMTGVPGGTYTLRVTRSAHDAMELRGVRLRGGEDLTIPETLVLAASRGALSGRATLAGESHHGGTTLELSNTLFTTTTVSDGSFLFAGVCVGSGYELRANHDDFVEYVVGGLEIVADTMTTVDPFQLARQQGDLVLAEGATFTRSQTISMRMIAPPGTTLMRAAEGAAGLDAQGRLDLLASVAWTPYALNGSYTLTAGDGRKTVYAQSSDGTTESAVLSDDVILDTTPPASASLLVNGGAFFTNTAEGTVQLSLGAVDSLSGVAEMMLSWDSDFGDDSWVPFAPVLTYPIADPAVTPLADGIKTFYVVFKDGAGNAMSPGQAAQAQIELDRVPPTLTGLTIDCHGVADALYCNTPVVTVSVQLASPDASVTMALSNTGSFGAASFTELAPQVVWMVSPGDGLKTVSIMLRDAAGNFTTGTDHDTIVIDSVAPSFTAALRGDSLGGTSTELTRSPTVSLVLDADDTETADADLRMRVANNASFVDDAGVPLAWTAYQDLTTGHALSASAIAGTKIVYVQVRDLAGNVAAGQASILLDPHAPTATIRLDDGAAFTSDRLIALQITADAGDSAKMAVVNDDPAMDCASATFVDFAPSSAWLLPDSDGPHDVTVCLQDAAGNTSAPATARITLDRAPPVGSVVIQGIRADQSTSATHTAQRAVTLLVSPGDAVRMKVSNQSDLADASWEPIRTQFAWQLSEGDSATKSVYLHLEDAAGNAIVSAISDAIHLDTIAPPAPSVTLPTAAQSPNNLTMQISASEAAEMRIHGAVDANGVEDYGSWSSLPAGPITVSLSPSGTEPRRVAVEVRDEARNVSQQTLVSVLVDALAPVMGTMVVGDGSGYVTTSNGQTTVDVACVDESDLTLVITAGGVERYNGPYVSPVDVLLGASQGAKDIVATCSDPAGNATTSAVETVMLDYTPPQLAGAFTLNGGGAVERTKNDVVTAHLTLLDPHAGGIEVALAAAAINCAAASFVYSVPHGVAQDLAFQLSAGDGLRELYLCARDAAGNITPTATAASNAIYLDTTGPGTPALQVVDINGDGFALSSSHVELQWSAPADADLSGFDMQRLIQGADNDFVDLRSFAAGATSFSDASAVAGGVHNYRIRAKDDLGNTSAWSMVARAQPFEPIGEIDVVRSDGSYRYDFKPNEGTFWLQPVYSWENRDHSTGQIVLPTNLTYFEKDFYPERFNETLTLRVWNQDSSLVYDVGVPLRINERIRVAESSYQYQKAIVVDPAGVVHVAYLAYGGSAPVTYATYEGGTWTTRWTSSVARSLDMVLDDEGAVHMCLHHANGGISYVTNASGSFVKETADTAADATPSFCAIALDSTGKAHICTYKYDTQDLRYSTNASGAWASELVDTTGNVGQNCSIALDSGDRVHIAYQNDTTFRTMHAQGVAGGPWTLDVLGNRGHTAIVIDANDKVHIAHARQRVYYSSNVTGTWTTQTLTPRGSYVDINVLDSGEVFIAHDANNTEGDVGFTTNASGSWETRWLDTAEDVAGHLAMAMDRYQGVHILYEGPSPQRLRYVVDRSRQWVRTKVEETVGVFERDSSVAVDHRGRTHVAYTKSTYTGLRLARQHGATWQYEDLDAGEAQFLCLRSDDHGDLHLIYGRPTTTELVYATNASGAWVSEVAATGVVGTGYWYANLAIDAVGRVHVGHCYAGGGGAKYTTNSSGAWTTELAQSVESFGCSLDVDAAGKVHMGYFRTPSPQAFYYATNATGVWQHTSLDSTVNLNHRSSSTWVDDSGHVHLAYWQGVSGQALNAVRYATNASGDWVKGDAGRVYNAGQEQVSLKLAVTPDGARHITLLESAQRVVYISDRSGEWRTTTLATWDMQPLWAGQPNPDLSVDAWGHLHMSFVDSPTTSVSDPNYMRDFQARVLRASSVKQTEAF